MRTEIKDWYFYKRNGIYYVILKDKITGERLTAKSTGKRKLLEAEKIASKWFYEPTSFFNLQQKKGNKRLLKKLLSETDFSDDDIVDVLQTFLGSKGFNIEKDACFKAPDNNMLVNHNTGIYQTAPAPINNLSEEQNIKQIVLPNKKKVPTELKEIIENIDTMTFTEYMFLFWDYEKSPYIKQFHKLGKKPPNPERFLVATKALKRYFSLFWEDDCLLKDIEVDDINIFLGKLKNKLGLAEITIASPRNAIAQALKFLYKNGIFSNNISDDIVYYSNSKNNIEKQIFSTKELKVLSDNKKNVFGNKCFYLINRLLITTGCRIGEILALNTNDLIKNDDGYYLHISKNLTIGTKRIKETKTNRVDDIPISNEMAEMLLKYIETLENKKGFLFPSPILKDRAISYTSVGNNFRKTIKKLGFKRAGLTIHSYRHTFSCRLLEAGFSKMQMMFLTRHDSISQLINYSNHNSNERDKIKRKACDYTEKLLL